MRWVRFAVLVILASVLQTGLMGAMAVLRPAIKPDLMLILMVFFATRCRSTDAVIASFTIGFVADLISPVLGLMGPRIISFGLFGTLLSDLQGIIATRRPIYQAIAILLTGLLTGGVTLLLTFLRADAVTTNVSAQLFWQPLYSAILGPLLAMPIAWWMHMNGKASRYRVKRSRRR